MLSIHAFREIPNRPINAERARSTEGTKGVCRRIQEAACWVWEASKIGFQTTWDKASFVFFRVFEWVHPMLGPRLENVFLRVSNIWTSIRTAWKEKAVQEEIDALRLENQGLRLRVELEGNFAQLEAKRLAFPVSI